MRINACVEHLDFHEADLTPDARWDKPGHLVGSGILYPGGEVRWLNCDMGCKWASSPKVEQALGSVGNPTERRRGNDANQVLSEYDAPEIVVRKRMKKEKNVAKTPELTPRIRRKPVDTRKFGNISVSLYIEGLTPENFAALTTPEAMDFHDLLKSIKAETPKGA